MTSPRPSAFSEVLRRLRGRDAGCCSRSRRVRGADSALAEIPLQG